MEQNFFMSQGLLLPELEFSAPESMYVRLNDRASANFMARSMRYKIGGASSFDTNFNAVSVEKLKLVTIIDTIDTLYLTLEGEGRFTLRVGLRRLGNFQSWLCEQEVILLLTAPLAMPWAELEGGMLDFLPEALEQGELTGGRFLTATVPAQEVKLGGGARFNRKAFVVSAIARMREGLLTPPSGNGKIEPIVVNNSRNMTEDEAIGATLFPNLNYGGSGGFTREFLHLIDNGFTHCLFMDDDATYEIDSLRRAYALQCLARKPELAISTALLRELEPNRMFEKGAVYDTRRWRPLNHWRDMSLCNDLLEAERLRERGVYGAWSFFCFKIAKIKFFPFPFFGRGDDALVSIVNDFDMETVNGVSCWGEDFQLKENPATRCLGLRSTLAILLQTAQAGRFHTLRIVLGWLVTSLFSHNYASAGAILKTIRGVSGGPVFRKDNLDTANVRAKLAPLNTEEKMQSVCLADFKLRYLGDQERLLRRCIRLITLNGFLLPGFLMRDSTVYENKSFRASYLNILRYKQVLYFYEAMEPGYVAKYDRGRFSAILLQFSLIMKDFLSKLPDIGRSYQVALPEMTSGQFWQKLYQEKSE